MGNMQTVLPAFSWPLDRENQPAVLPVPWQEITTEWAWGSATGHGMKVCIIDSGIDAEHQRLGGMVRGGVVVERTASVPVIHEGPHGDLFGHGTACAGIIHELAPDAELYSVQVLGSNLKGGGDALVAGIRWAIENRMDVVNLSLSTRKQEYAAELHDLADQAYFQGTALVASANNVPVRSYPWHFSSVISVASHSERNPYTFYYNPHPPVEFMGRGLDVDLAWSGGGTSIGSGNSFATPHIAGIAALIRSKHPGLTPFQLKTVLYYTSRNVRDALERRREETAGD